MNKIRLVSRQLADLFQGMDIILEKPFDGYGDQTECSLFTQFREPMVDCDIKEGRPISCGQLPDIMYACEEKCHAWMTLHYTAEVLEHFWSKNLVFDLCL